MAFGWRLHERNHNLILVATRWQRRAGLILLRSGLGGLPFGFSAPTLLPVFFCARRASGLVRDCWLGAGPAYAKLLRPLSSLFSKVSGVLFALRPLIPGLIVKGGGVRKAAFAVISRFPECASVRPVGTRVWVAAERICLWRGSVSYR